MKPYYSDDYATLYHGDCRDVLRSLTFDKSTTFAFTDPPYNVGMQYNGWNDSLPEAEYLEFCQRWIDDLQSISQSCCIYTPRKWMREYWWMLGKGYSQIVLTWRTEGAVRGKFVSQHASLLSDATPVRRIKDVWDNLKLPSQGFYFREDKFGRPGYTSADLTNRILFDLANPEHRIIDPFVGTGTTLLCAKRFYRKAIGIEYSEYWCEVAAKRLAQESVLPLDLTGAHSQLQSAPKPEQRSLFDANK